MHERSGTRGTEQREQHNTTWCTTETLLPTLLSEFIIESSATTHSDRQQTIDDSKSSNLFLTRRRKDN